MSNTRYTIAKNFIANKEYSKAREILEQINEPKAEDWLRKLNELDPPPVQPIVTKILESKDVQLNSDHQRELFFENANKDRERGRIGRGVALIIIAVIIVGYLQSNWVNIVLLSSTRISIANVALTPLSGIPILAIGLGAFALLCLIAGIVLLADGDMREK